MAIICLSEVKQEPPTVTIRHESDQSDVPVITVVGRKR
jgi:hypothetical protein